MNLRTAIGFAILGIVTLLSMCAGFTFSEPMCRTVECLPSDGGVDG